MSFPHSIPTHLPRPLDTLPRRNLRKNRNHILRHEGTQLQITTTQRNFNNNTEKRENTTRYAKNIDTHDTTPSEWKKTKNIDTNWDQIYWDFFAKLPKTTKNAKNSSKNTGNDQTDPKIHTKSADPVFTPTSRLKCRNEEYKHTRKRHTWEEHTRKGHT